MTSTKVRIRRQLPLPIDCYARLIGTRIPPSIVHLIREGVPLTDLQAAAGKLWLACAGKELDQRGALAAVIEAYCCTRPVAEPYWGFLGNRGRCANCGET